MLELDSQILYHLHWWGVPATAKNSSVHSGLSKVSLGIEVDEIYFCGMPSSLNIEDK